MNPPEIWRAIRARPSEADRALLVDVGTTSLTGLRTMMRSPAKTVGWLGHPVMATLALSAADGAALGSDFARTGFLHAALPEEDGCVVDPFGIAWTCIDGVLAPSAHPFQDLPISEIARQPRPAWPTLAQLPESCAGDLIAIVDPPCPGLLEMAFGLRGAWNCLQDLVSDEAGATQLLDWSIETIIAAYEALLGGLPVAPDIVVYADDLGFRQNMFISESDFRKFLRPRMKLLLSHLRKLSPAALCFHSCGAIAPILGDLADLGFDLFNLEGGARGMGCGEVRKLLPRHAVMHGCSDLVALGRAVRGQDLRAVALLTSEVVDAMPVIAAPHDSLACASDVEDAQLGAAFLHLLDPDDIDAIARLGPVKSILERTTRRARHVRRPPLRFGPVRTVALDWSSAPAVTRIRLM